MDRSSLSLLPHHSWFGFSFEMPPAKTVVHEARETNHTLVIGTATAVDVQWIHRGCERLYRHGLDQVAFFASDNDARRAFTEPLCEKGPAQGGAEPRSLRQSATAGESVGRVAEGFDISVASSPRPRVLVSEPLYEAVQHIGRHDAREIPEDFHADGGLTLAARRRRRCKPQHCRCGGRSLGTHRRVGEQCGPHGPLRLVPCVGGGRISRIGSGLGRIPEDKTWQSAWRSSVAGLRA